MNNLTDKQTLKELSCVIDTLDRVLADLQQGEPLPEPGSGHLLGQWHRLFAGNARTRQEPDALPVLPQLAATLEQQLARLRRCQRRFDQLQQLGGEQLLQAARRLQLAACAPPASASLVQELESLEHHGYPGRVWSLFECYGQALAQCAAPPAEPDLHHELCYKLQQLIDELHFTGEVGAELTAIQSRLLDKPRPDTLPALCLRLIELVIEGCRQERQQSTRFLTRLNGSLGDMHHHFAISLSEGQALFDARAHHGHHIAGELRAIGEHLVGQGDAALQAEIEPRLRSINHILDQHQRLQEREQSLLDRLDAMEQQLTELKEEAEQYRQRLTTQNEKLFIDSLTQIYNRAAMNERLELEYRRWLRYREPLAIALLDIDYFKEINDRFGHLAGDKALRLIARTIKKSLRETDFVARFGGEEFVILLLNVSGEHLNRPLETLREEIRKIPFRFKEERVTITASIGATLLRAGDSTTSALERADQALYRAKHAGRNQLVID